LFCAIMLGIIGAIFTDNGHWTYFALAGAALGLIVSLVKDFDNAWRTIAGVLAGGVVGAIIAAFIHNNVWSMNILFGLGLLGGILFSESAMEDVFKQEPKIRRSYPKTDEEEEVTRDALGNQIYNTMTNICGHCRHYDESEYNRCTYFNRMVNFHDHSCHCYSI